jgi:hypothetical protein
MVTSIIKLLFDVTPRFAFAGIEIDMREPIMMCLLCFRIKSHQAIDGECGLPEPNTKIDSDHSLCYVVSRYIM